MAENTDGSRETLAGKVAVVTGGVSGIGRATCARLIGAGASVAVVDLHHDAVDDAVKDLLALDPGASVIGITGDVRREPDMADMAGRVAQRFDRIDILIHSAGILRAAGSGPKPMHRVSVEECNLVIDTNLKGTFLSNRAVLPIMMKQRSGQIVNISSVSGMEARAMDAVYCASKFGVVGLTESLADEVRKYGVRVFLVLPDAVDTPMWDQNGPIPAPEGALPPERVARWIEHLLSLPADMTIGRTVVSAFRSRDRRR